MRTAWYILRWMPVLLLLSLLLLLLFPKSYLCHESKVQNSQPAIRCADQVAGVGVCTTVYSSTSRCVASSGQQPATSLHPEGFMRDNQTARNVSKPQGQQDHNLLTRMKEPSIQQLLQVTYDSNVNQVSHIIRLALTELLSIQPRHRQHAPAGQLTVGLRDHNLKQMTGQALSSQGQLWRL